MQHLLIIWSKDIVSTSLIGRIRVTCPYLSKLVHTCPNLSKLVQTWYSFYILDRKNNGCFISSITSLTVKVTQHWTILSKNPYQKLSEIRMNKKNRTVAQINCQYVWNLPQNRKQISNRPEIVRNPFKIKGIT